MTMLLDAIRVAVSSLRAKNARSVQNTFSRMQFRDRKDAGDKLAEALAKHHGEDVLVYALPRGGVVVGARIAEKLGAQIDLVIVRKIGHPWSPEYAIGATSESGRTIFNETERAVIDKEQLKRLMAEERAEARRRREVYLKDRPPLSAFGKTAIVVDDGVATGLTLLCAIEEIRAQKPKKLIVAVPVAPEDTAARIREKADEFVALDVPRHFLGAVGAYYDDFRQTQDEEVIALLEENRKRRKPSRRTAVHRVS